MSVTHSLLRRQLKRFFGDTVEIPTEWHGFLEVVNNAYIEFDEDRETLERSLELSSSELLQKNSEMRAVLQAFPDLFIWLDDTGKILDCKGGGTTELYISPKDLIGKRIQDVPEQGISVKFSDAINDIKAEKRFVVNIEYSMRLKDVDRYYEARLLRLRQNQMIAIIRNITERKTAETALAAEHDSLEKTVEVRTSELRDSLQQLEEANLFLEEANEHKNRFLSTMSHELRTPLNAIIGYADLLDGKFFGELNDIQSAYVKKIDDSGEHLLALITDLLDLARIDTGEMELESENFPFQDILFRTIDMLSSQILKRGIKVVKQIPSTLPMITGDKRKCMQIVLNLLTNAIKFSPPRSKIRVIAEVAENGFIRISVGDQGPGIPFDQQDDIFREFYQVDRVRDAELGGVGVGLALSRRLVEMHGGSIGVESEPGKGSVFWFLIPITNDNSGLAIADESGEANLSLESVGRHILVAEDNDVNLSMILDMLSMQKHSVTIARNGEEAVKLAISKSPDLILMDVRMPKIDGLEATRILRAEPDFPDIPIIALTASAGEKSREKSLHAGCTDHLSKPVRIKELFAALDRHLKKDEEVPISRKP